MISTNWEDSSIIKRKLTSANFTKKIKKSGLPVLYDNNKLYIDNRTNNTLIIGVSGSVMSVKTIINLKENMLVSGSGTSSDPYIVQ